VLERIAPVCCIVGGSIIAATAQLTVPLVAVAVGPVVTVAVGAVAGVALLLVPRRKRKARRAA
jgi:hypothetical protein